MNELGNHLWQSTFFAAAAAVACFAVRHNRARVRYWLWFAASVKFLIPFSLLVGLGGRVDIRVVPVSVPAIRVEQLSTSFAPVTSAARAARHPLATPWWPRALAAIWIAGSILSTARWLRRWRALRCVRKQGRPVPLDFPIPVLIAPSGIEPGVFGVFRPVLLIPEGLSATLAPDQLETVLAHELCHVRSRDNLTAGLHIVVGAIFWFHPAIWWIGRRLIEERERACDEAVLGHGSRPETYAQSILNICKFYAELPLPCASGVTGADLKKRIREIMTRRVSLRLTLARKLALTCAAIAAVTVPLVIGVLRAQTLPPPPSYMYEVVSIKPSAPGEQGSRTGPGPQGGIRMQNVTAMNMLTFAYDVRTYQFAGAPGWLQSDRFDVSFTPDKAEIAPAPGMGRPQLEGWMNRNRQRLQAVLRDRFGLVLRAETHELPVYALVVAKNGPKLTPAADPKAMNMTANRGKMEGKAVYLKTLTDSLSGLLGRHVTNETGLDGPYDFKLEWTPDAPVQPPQPGEPAELADAGTSIFTALTEQLGLKLESKKGPVPVFVIERITKPTEN
jgi:uncharacterized protein (TIGR03435 family)